MMARTAAGSYLAHARQMMRHAAAVHATVARRLPTANETWQNKLDLYVPLPALRPGTAAPLVVFIHGGAFQHGGCVRIARACAAGGTSLTRHGPPHTGGRVWLPTWLWAWRKRGYAIASVDYRFEAFPAPVDDVRAAVRWLAGNTVRYGIDPRRISVIGSSSGEQP